MANVQPFVLIPNTSPKILCTHKTMAIVQSFVLTDISPKILCTHKFIATCTGSLLYNIFHVNNYHLDRLCENGTMDTLILITQERPLLIWGWRKSKFRRPFSRKKKISRGLPGKKINFKRPRRGKKKIQKGLPGKKINLKIFPLEKKKISSTFLIGYDKEKKNLQEPPGEKKN